MKSRRTECGIWEKQENVEEKKPISSIVFAVALAVYAFITFFILLLVSKLQPEPYLDEVFHIPQAKQYCQGNFTHWDDKITTLPGLYLFSIGVLKPLSEVTGYNFCGTFHLRCTNILLAVCNFSLYCWLTARLHFSSRGVKNWKGLLSAINLAIFPPLYFFSFLYYTDMAAVCLVLLMYNLHLDGRNHWAAAVGVVATVMRQTNIVWTILVAIGCLDVSLRRLFLTPKERKDSNLIQSWREVPALYRGLMRLRKETISSQVSLVTQLTLNILPFLLVGATFVVFVWYNGGLVVGDRTAHQATLHIPQIFYFFALMATSPHFYPFLKPFLASCARNWWSLLLPVVIAINLIVRFNTVVHPYLLADNRHYTFYIWKRVFEQRPLIRYLLFPIYMFGAYAVTRTLLQRQSFIFVLGFLACSFVSLVPQRLLEIRYFFIPYILVRLHIPPQSGKALLLESLAFVAINAVTLYLFLYRPFYWADSSSAQRFMW